jgi:N utilization substance protein B
MSSRREARERAMQALYAFTIGGDDAEHILATVVDEQLGDDKTAKNFAKKLFLSTMDLAEEADVLVSRYTQNWDLERIAWIDRLLLRMAICEMIHFKDIPPKVSINEAIEIAKRYSTSKSGKFINGILDAVLLDLHKEGRLKKSGRGLVGMESLLAKSKEEDPSAS